jgi:hypothetical protein
MTAWHPCRRGTAPAARRDSAGFVLLGARATRAAPRATASPRRRHLRAAPFRHIAHGKAISA